MVTIFLFLSISIILAALSFKISCFIVESAVHVPVELSAAIASAAFSNGNTLST